jgi:hypothetical protein
VLGPVEEGQLDGLSPEAKERLLFPQLTSERHARVAAQRAEFHELAASPP